MAKLIISAPLLKKRVENKAYAYGASPIVATLISEYVIKILKEANQQQNLNQPLTAN